MKTDIAKKKSRPAAATTARGKSVVSTKVGDNNKKKRSNNSNSNSNNNKKQKKNNGAAKKKANNKNNDINWITSLARDNASNDNGTGAKIPSKEDRKRKRELKKNRRIEQQEEKQLQRHQQQQHQSTHALKNAPPKTMHTSGGASSSSQQQQQQSVLLELSKHRIRRMSRNLLALRKEIYNDIYNNEKTTTTTKEKPLRPTPYYLPENIDKLKKRKRTKRQQWNENSIQPSKSDYSGIGLARISMFIEFIDPSYYAKLEEEFQEHIPGFFGKQRTKAMKRQTDGNMLWRRLANEKKKMSKKSIGMSADERVKAMIDSSTRAGLLR